jgi:hypothetical protein
MVYHPVRDRGQFGEALAVQWAANSTGRLDLDWKLQPWRFVGRETDAFTSRHSVQQRSRDSSGLKRTEREVSWP